MKLFLLAAFVTLAYGRPPIPQWQFWRDNRIVSGFPITIEEAPHQLMLEYRNSFSCGATLISPTWVLTAAHCVDSRSASDITFVAGMENRTQEYTDPHVERHTTAQCIQHAQFSMTDTPNDIAVCELNTAVTMSPQRQVIAYDGGDGTPHAPEECAISGWGKEGGLDPTTDQLHGVYITVISNAQCSTLWGQTIHPGQVCLYDGEDGACSGDSGGPLTCPKDPVSAQIVSGATSWGSALCRDSTFPSVYTRVSYYKDWVFQNSGVLPNGGK